MELFYLTIDNKLMAAANGDGSAFEVGAVRSSFDMRPGGPARYAYDVSPDGQRFLVNPFREETAAAPITLVVNWPAALKK